MNPFVLQLVGGIVRALLASVAGWLVREGIIEAGAVEKFYAGATLLIVTAAYSAWQKYKSRQKLQTALALAPMTEKDLETKIAEGTTASVTTAKDQQPEAVTVG